MRACSGDDRTTTSSVAVLTKAGLCLAVTVAVNVEVLPGWNVLRGMKNISVDKEVAGRSIDGPLCSAHLYRKPGCCWAHEEGRTSSTARKSEEAAITRLLVSAIATVCRAAADRSTSIVAAPLKPSQLVTVSCKR